MNLTPTRTDLITIPKAVYNRLQDEVHDRRNAMASIEGNILLWHVRSRRPEIAVDKIIAILNKQKEKSYR